MITPEQRIEAERLAAELEAEEAAKLTTHEKVKLARVPQYIPREEAPPMEVAFPSDHPSILVKHIDGFELTTEGTLAKLHALSLAKLQAEGLA